MAEIGNLHIDSQDDNMATFLDLMTFILLNRGDKTFIGYDEDHIATMVAKHLADNTCWITHDYHGNITGMIIATPNHQDKLLFIDENLSMNTTNLVAFARRAKEVFKGYTLEFFKHGKYHLDKGNELYDRLTA